MYLNNSYEDCRADLGCRYYSDLDGNPIRKTPETNPYDYDSFVIYIDPLYKKGKGKSVDSDRLYQWDSNKYNECHLKIWNNTRQDFFYATPEEINKFLNLYFNRNLKLLAILQCCNCGNGYPYWTFIYEESYYINTRAINVYCVKYIDEINNEFSAEFIKAESEDDALKQFNSSKENMNYKILDVSFSRTIY